MATATKTRQLLTVKQATSQARRHVDRIMPGVLATVESKLSHDLGTNTPIVVTTVTFPRQHIGRLDLQIALGAPRDGRRVQSFPDRIVVTRTR